MQDLIHQYVSDLNRLREEFHSELGATAEELSKALGQYAQRNEAMLASFLDKASARGRELEAAAAARLVQFQGLPVDNIPPKVDDAASGAEGRKAAGIAIRDWQAAGKGPVSERNGDREPRPTPLNEPVETEGRLTHFMTTPASDASGEVRPTDADVAKND